MNNKLVAVLALCLLCGPLYGVDAMIRKIEVKEGAKKIVSLQRAKPSLVEDSNVAKLVSAGNGGDYYVEGLSIGKTSVVCRKPDGAQEILEITVVPRYWSTLQFLFENNPNISLAVTDGHVIISGQVLQNSLMEKVNKAVDLDKKRIINNVTLSHTDLLKRIDSYLRAEKFDGVKTEVMDRTVYLSGKVFDKAKRDKLLSVLLSYAKPAGFSLNSSGVILSGSQLTVEVRFVSVDKGKNDNMGLSTDEIKYSMQFAPSASHSYDSSNNPNVVKKAAYGGDATVTNSGTFNIQKIRNAMKILFDSRLATRSGETAKLQRGGTVYEKIEGVQAVDLREINYGFMVNVTPTMVNAKTITADVDIQVSEPTNRNPLTIAKYNMTAKYTVSPGEVILINKMNAINDTVAKQGIPILSDIPFVGSIFDNDSANTSNANIILLLRVTLPEEEAKREAAMKALEKFNEAQQTPTSAGSFVEEAVDSLIEEGTKDTKDLEKAGEKTAGALEEL